MPTLEEETPEIEGQIDTSVEIEKVRKLKQEIAAERQIQTNSRERVSELLWKTGNIIRKPEVAKAILEHLTRTIPNFITFISPIETTNNQISIRFSTNNQFYCLNYYLDSKELTLSELKQAVSPEEKQEPASHQSPVANIPADIKEHLTSITKQRTETYPDLSALCWAPVELEDLA